MNLLNANMFRSGLFKQARFLVSSPMMAQPVIVISETGYISKEVLPMETGYISAEKSYLAWIVLHSLKIVLEDTHGRCEDTPYLLLSERSFIPLDPFKRLKPGDKSGIMSLNTLAKIKHRQVREKVGRMGNTTARDRLLVGATNAALLIVGIMVFAALISHFAGGG